MWCQCLSLLYSLLERLLPILLYMTFVLPSLITCTEADTIITICFLYEYFCSTLHVFKQMLLNYSEHSYPMKFLDTVQSFLADTCILNDFKLELLFLYWLLWCHLLCMIITFCMYFILFSNDFQSRY